MPAKKKKESTHGGARPGAGKKSTLRPGPYVNTGITINQELLFKIKAFCVANKRTFSSVVNEGLENILDQYEKES